MNNRTKSNRLDPLPAVFYTTSGIIDSNIIEAIWKNSNIPLRELKNLIGNGRNPEERINELARRLVDEDFRNKWYNDRYQKKKNSVMPFFVLTMDYTAKFSKKLSWESPSLKSMFNINNADQKRYPALEKIPALAVYLSSEPTLAIESALFAWALMESSKYHAQRAFGNQREALRKMPELLRNELSSMHGNHLITLLEPQAKNFENDTNPSSSAVHPAVSKTAAVTLDFKTKHGAWYMDIRRLASELELCKIHLPKFSAHVLKSAERITLNPTLISLHEKLLSDAEIAFRAATEFNEKSHEVESKISALANLTISDWASDLVFNLDSEHTTRIPSDNAIEDILSDLYSSEHSIELLEAIPYADVREQLKNFSKENFTYKTARANLFFKNLYNEAVEIITVKKLFDLAKEKIFDNAHNLSWNAVKDENISEGEWNVLYKEFRSKSKFSTTSSLLVRNTFAVTSYEFVDDLHNAFVLDGAIKIPQLVNAVSRLGYNQIEQVFRLNPELHDVVALAQLQNFLVDINSDQLEAFKWWSREPLSNFAQHYDAEIGYLPNARFFTAVYTTVTSAKINLFDLLINPRKDFETESQKVDVDSKADRLELEEFLTYRQHGAGTYATLWRAAYLSVFDPLLRQIKTVDLETSIRLVAASLKDVVIDALYSEWLKSIPTNLWQESQYEKATKVYVNARIKSILLWCDKWLSFRARSELPASNDNLLTYQFISDVEADSPEIGSWLLELRRTANAAERESGPTLPTSKHPGKATVMMPRSYLREISGQCQDWSLVITDELINNLVNPNPLDILAVYRDIKNIEAVESICNSYRHLLQAEEAEGIEAHIELEEIKYAVRLGDLKARLESADSDKTDWVLLEECQQYLSDRRWTRLEASLLLLEMSIEDAEKRKADEIERAHLISSIRALDCDCDPDLEIGELRAKLTEANKYAAPRRVHIKPIKELGSTPGVAIEIIELAKSVLENFDQPQNLPSKEISEFFAEVFNLIFTPIGHQLRRPASLNPSYRQSLERLCVWLLQNLLIEPLGTDKEQIFADACVQLCSRIEQISSSDDIEQIIAEFSEFGTYRLGPLALLESEAEIQSVKVVSSLEPLSSPEYHSAHLSSNEIDTHIHNIKIWLNTLPTGVGTPLSYRDRHQYIKNRNWDSGLQSSLPVTDDDSLASAIICSFSIYLPPENILNAGLAVLSLKHDAPCFGLIRMMRPDVSPIGKWFFYFFSNLLSIPAGQNNELDYRSYLGGLIRQLGDLSRQHDMPLKVSSEMSDGLRMFDLAVATNGDLINLLWDQFSGDKAQAEIRGMLLVAFWKLRLFNCLTECLTFAPIDLEARLSKGYVRLIQQAEQNLPADAIENLRRASSAKAYTIFAERVFSELGRNVGLPATITWGGALERTTERGRWRGMLRIAPRAVNPPLDIDIKFVRTQFLTLANGENRLSIKGPLFEERIIELSLDVRTHELQHFDLEMECFFTTVDGTTTSSSLKLETELNGFSEFKGLTPHHIDDAFASFPSRHMRGTEFVDRPQDEDRIEKILFSSNDAGSLWMASPRRSGKTSMLFRILDAYSHNAGRDNAILYFTVDRHFESTEKFNQWVWSSVRSGMDNEGLRKQIEGLTRLGESLPFDGGVNDFLRCLAELVIEKIPKINRVYFMFDEVDRFAEMHLAGGNLGKTVMQLMWQLRHVLSSNANIGFVFAGSSLARRFFVESAEAAFYNSIPSLELTPFNNLTPESALNARKVVMPLRLNGTYKLPDVSLKHLLAITAGIPYYMKLVAGATYSVARQQTLLVTDVNRGLESILNKSTGITRIDSLDNPGEDELRTLYASSEIDRIMAKAVLFGIAEMRSPLDQRGVRAGELRGDRSPLVYRYKISRELIDKGISICTNLGYLTRTLDSELIFTIPILGESIRHRHALLWSTIEEKLEIFARQK